MSTALLEEYIHRFWGYGRWQRPVWFLGMEEGVLQANNGNAPVTLQTRLEHWRIHGCPELENAPEFCRALDLAEYFHDPPSPQQTWDKLTRIYLNIRGGNAGVFQPINNISQHQHIYPFRRNRFGQGHDDFTAIELFPLPSANADEWPHAGFENQLSYMINRDTYAHSVFSHRAASLRRKVHIFRPNVILCYGGEHKELYEGVFETRFGPQNPNAPVAQAQVPGIQTQVYFINHVGGAFGVRNVVLDTIGEFIGDQFPNLRHQL